MTTRIHPVQLQYNHAIGRAEFSEPGFRAPVAVARGAEDLVDVLSCSYEGRPDGKCITVCAVGEAYITEFGRGIRVEGASAFSVDGSFMWHTSLALEKEGNDYVADEWLYRMSIFTTDGDRIGHTPQEG